MSNRSKGIMGEMEAESYFIGRGYTILDRNYSVGPGEIDLIAKSPDDIIVFIEVKYRTALHHGTPAEAVTKQKQRHIITTAKFWLSNNTVSYEALRFDVIEIRPGYINHIKSAFTA